MKDCYQVLAYDAAGNESELSEEVCVDVATTTQPEMTWEGMTWVFLVLVIIVGIVAWLRGR